jgi:hypothetical protein
MPKLHELSWDEIRGHLEAIAEEHSGSVIGEMREKLLARALVLVMDRLTQTPRFSRSDLIERCPDCGGTGRPGQEASESVRRLGYNRACEGCQGKGARLTEAGRAVAEAMRWR